MDGLASDDDGLASGDCFLETISMEIEQPRMESLEDIELASSSPFQPCQSSANSSQIVYTPQVKNSLIPKVGQHFDNLEDVQKFYNEYAKESGFGTRKNSSKRNREQEIVRKEYVCCKEGVRKAIAKNSEPKRKRGETREGCLAKLVVVKDSEGAGFVVKQFIEGHTHPLTTPRRVHLLHSHRDVSIAKRALTQQLAAANVPTHQQMSLLEMEAGGIENVGCIQRDLYNVQRDRRKMFAGFDGMNLYEHFESKKKKNPSFMYSFKKDSNGHMVNCFWADAACLKSYEYFGDVVIFDTTYKTNRYALIFAPILGVNHHGQTTLFGCGFLTEEKVEYFEWLFREWLKVMPGGHPKMIISDQDPAMGKAIANIFPNTHHRYCIWHIVMKFSEKIGAISYRDHYEEFKNCIWKSDTPEEFEAKWENVVQKAELSDNEWLKAMYLKRARWVPAYMKDMFSAGMTSSQRAESEHCFFKRYCSSNNSMLEFVTRFNRALAHIRHNELDLDHKDMNEKPLLKTAYVMESTMSEIYTRNVFYKFQDELFQSSAYSLTMKHEDEQRCVYHVQRVNVVGSKGREVFVDKSSNFVTCTCKKFEVEGIPCRHILKYFTRHDVMELPEQYILRRWTKSAKASRLRDGQVVGRKGNCDRNLLVTRNRLHQRASHVIDDALVTEDGVEIMDELFENAEKRLAEKKRVREEGEGSAIEVPIPVAREIHLKEPQKCRTKGSGKRLKGGKEKSMKKGRRCTGCGLMNQNHDKRNCPKLLNKSSQASILNDDDDEDNDDDDDEYEDDD